MSEILGCPHKPGSITFTDSKGNYVIRCEFCLEIITESSF